MLTVLIAGGGVASAATSHASTTHHRGFPIPSCRWAGPAAVSGALGVRVRALAPAWSTQRAPILRCRFVETKVHLQVRGRPIVSIEFRELQRFHLDASYRFVRGLGRCVARSSCPKPRRPAWLHVSQSISAGTPYAMRFGSGLTLGVEDGLNSIVIQIQNPRGPLPIASEVGAAERLARSLLHRFFWR